MYNLVDLVQLKTKKKREEIEEILTAAIEVTKENIKDGNDVWWVGLCKFTWKQKAKTKKEAKEWTEYPYMAIGDKVRCLEDESIEGLQAKEGIMRMEKQDVQVSVVKT